MKTKITNFFLLVVFFTFNITFHANATNWYVDIAASQADSIIIDMDGNKVITANFIVVHSLENDHEYWPEINWPEVDSINPDVLNADEIYYVSNSGDNSNTGQSTAGAWLSIQYAADNVPAGSRIIVLQGTYNERVSINISEETSHYTIFEAEGDVTMEGFLIYSDNIAIKNFNIIGDENIGMWKGGGIWISGNNISIYNNIISGFTSSAGILASWSGTDINDNVHIKDNYIDGCNQGMSIEGTNWLVEDNQIHRLIRSSQGGDADYFRFFGNNIIIRNNLMWGTRQEELGPSHTDLFQSFHHNGSYAHDVLIEQNYGIGFFAQGLMLECVQQSHTNIILHKNVFVNANSWQVAAKGVEGIHVINNTFFNSAIQGIGFRILYDSGNATSGTIKNNIIAYSNSSYFAEAYCSYENGYNLIFNCRNNPNPGSETDLIGVDPLFNATSVDLTVEQCLGPDMIPFTGDGEALDLQAGSQAIGAGEKGLDIGAYEYTTGTNIHTASTENKEIFHIYPNPFKSVTTIEYTLPEGSDVEITLYDLTGKRVKTIFSGTKSAGLQSIDLNCSDLSPGIYFIKVRNKNFTITKKCLIIK